MTKRLHLPHHRGGIEPGILATDQALAKIEDMKQPEIHRCPAARSTGELADDVSAEDRLIDDVVLALEPQDTP